MQKATETSKEDDLKYDFRGSIDQAVRQTVAEIQERLSEMDWTYNRTNFSPPDSTGKQYPVQTETGVVNKKTTESNSRNETTDIQLKEMQQAIMDIKEKLDQKEQIKEVIKVEKEKLSRWQIALMILGFCFIIEVAYKIYRIKKP